MKPTLACLAALLLTALAGAAAGGVAAGNPGAAANHADAAGNVFGSVRSGAPLRRLADGGISLDQAVQMAQSRYAARVVRADTERIGERIYYRLRLLSADGRVFSVRIDAQTGSFQ